MLNDTELFPPWDQEQHKNSYSYCPMQHSATIAHTIRQEEEIKGSQIRWKEIKLFPFAYYMI